eukprot:UN03872
MNFKNILCNIYKNIHNYYYYHNLQVGKTTGLLSQAPQFFYNQNIKDKNLYKHRINWLLYKKDLLQLVVENDF